MNKEVREIFCRPHKPDLEKVFKNGKQQEVSFCKTCGCLLYRELDEIVWYKPTYNKIKMKKKNPFDELKKRKKPMSFMMED